MTVLSEAKWRRREQPILSSMITESAWERVVLYNPSVIYHDGRYRMWYVGTGTFSRSADMCIGYAESEDGVNWRKHKSNPIMTPDDLPFGRSWQTPFVMFDVDMGLFRMWFVSIDSGDALTERPAYTRHLLGHAASVDGVRWRVHPAPLWPSARGPCVIKYSKDEYCMWMNSAPSPDDEFDALASNIYRFRSSNGINWERDPSPAVVAADPLKSAVYPFVNIGADGVTMLHGAHVKDGYFEIFSATSNDGANWIQRREQPAFPASRSPNLFDGRYASTPCVVEKSDRFLLYYSARDLGNLYGAVDGTIRSDGSGIYRHIGLAIAPKS